MGKIKLLVPAEICHELIVYLNLINDFGCCVYIQRIVYFAHKFDLRVSCDFRNKLPLHSYTTLTAWSQRWRRSDFQARSQNCVKSLLTSCLLYLRPSLRIEHLGSHWTDFHEIWYLSVFRKSVGNIQILLKSDKNNGYITWRPTYFFYHISVSSS
jgi:hypothetical protein